MKTQLATRQTQQLALTPQLRQALAVLQMSGIELDAQLAEAVESNPLLEWREDARALEIAHDPAGHGHPAESAAARTHPDAQWHGDGPDEEWRENAVAWSSGAGRGYDGDDSTAESAMAEDSLQQHLRWQLGLTKLSARDQQLGVALIDAIDDDGYLREPLDAIRAMLAPEIVAGEDELLAVLHLIQQFDPPGSGCRELGECLALQLRRLPDDTPARALALRICSEAIERLPRLGAQGIAAEFAVAGTEAEAAIALLRSLDPRPGARFGAIAHDAYVLPDAVIWRRRGVWQAALADRGQPRIAINREYARLAAGAGGRDGHYLRGCLQEARWLLKHLEQRGETLLRVVQCLLREQAGFLEFGPQALRPLTLREVATQLGLHESTVSRAIARKYVHTPRGTLALRDFFASGIETGGGEASSTAIQSMIRGLIDAEDPRKPLSDAALADRLKQAGVPVARRTVAKYREALAIAASHQRVRLG